jgi:hypothetical protein
MLHLPQIEGAPSFAFFLAKGGTARVEPCSQIVITVPPGTGAPSLSAAADETWDSKILTVRFHPGADLERGGKQ